MGLTEKILHYQQQEVDPPPGGGGSSKLAEFQKGKKKVVPKPNPKAALLLVLHTNTVSFQTPVL